MTNLRLTVNGSLNTQDAADAERIEFIQQYGKGSGVDFVREAVDCLMAMTKEYGHWTMALKRDPAFVNRILRAIDQIEAVAVDGKSDTVESGSEFNINSESFFDEE